MAYSGVGKCMGTGKCSVTGNCGGAGKCSVLGRIRGVEIVDGIWQMMDEQQLDADVVFSRCGIAALFWAADRGHEGLVRSLVSGMKPEWCKLQNAHGKTALSFAADSGHVSIVKFLVGVFGPDGCGIADSEGLLPLVHSMSESVVNNDLINYLVEEIKKRGISDDEISWRRYVCQVHSRKSVKQKLRICQKVKDKLTLGVSHDETCMILIETMRPDDLLFCFRRNLNRINPQVVKALLQKASSVWCSAADKVVVDELVQEALGERDDSPRFTASLQKIHDGETIALYSILLMSVAHGKPNISLVLIEHLAKFSLEGSCQSAEKQTQHKILGLALNECLIGNHWLLASRLVSTFGDFVNAFPELLSDVQFGLSDLYHHDQLVEGISVTDVCNIVGFTLEECLLVAIKYHRTADVRHLVEVENVNVNVAGKCQRVPFLSTMNAFTFAIIKDRQIAKYLFEHGALHDSRTTDGCTPLHTAALTNNLELATLLLRAGADVNAREKRKRAETALHQAALHAGPEMLRLLVHGGAHVSARAHAGFTPLHICVDRGYEAKVRTLIELKADVNARTELVSVQSTGFVEKTGGITPLSQACTHNHLEIARILMQAGANLGIVTNMAASISIPHRYIIYSTKSEYFDFVECFKRASQDFIFDDAGAIESVNPGTQPICNMAEVAKITVQYSYKFFQHDVPTATHQWVITDFKTSDMARCLIEGSLQQMIRHHQNIDLDATQVRTMVKGFPLVWKLLVLGPILMDHLSVLSVMQYLIQELKFDVNNLFFNDSDPLLVAISVSPSLNEKQVLLAIRNLMSCQDIDVNAYRGAQVPVPVPVPVCPDGFGFDTTCHSGHKVCRKQTFDLMQQTETEGNRVNTESKTNSINVLINYNLF